MSVRSNWIFHNTETQVSNGSEYKISNVGSETTLALSIAGTSTIYEIAFEVKGLVGDYEAIEGFDIKNSTLKSSAIQTDGKHWSFDLTGWDSFRVRIVSLNGNLTIQGKVVE